MSLPCRKCQRLGPQLVDLFILILIIALPIMMVLCILFVGSILLVGCGGQVVVSPEKLPLSPTPTVVHGIILTIPHDLWWHVGFAIGSCKKAKYLLERGTSHVTRVRIWGDVACVEKLIEDRRNDPFLDYIVPTPIIEEINP